MAETRDGGPEMDKNSKPPEPKGEKLPTKPKRGEVNPLWLDLVFPDPAAIFAAETPPLKELVETAVFALDANALLDPYQMSPRSLEEIESIYRKLAAEARLVAPAQAVREYGKNRGLKITAVYEQLHNLSSNLGESKDISCPSLEGLPEYETALGAIKQMRELKRTVTKAISELKAAILDWGWRDRVTRLYREVFTADRIVSPPAEFDLVADLEFRLTHSTPPAYKDGGKLDGGIGDLIIWHSLLQIGSTLAKPVVFVTNDEKTDWSHPSQKEAILPRTELIVEFIRKTGQHLAVVTWPRFLALMNASRATVQAAERVSARPAVQNEQTEVSLALQEAIDFARGVRVLMLDRVGLEHLKEGSSRGLVLGSLWGKMAPIPSLLTDRYDENGMSVDCRPIYEGLGAAIADLQDACVDVGQMSPTTNNLDLAHLKLNRPTAHVIDVCGHCLWALSLRRST